MNLTNGIITFYNDTKGFGFICEIDTEDEYYFHIKCFSINEKPNVGDVCEFIRAKGENGKLQAKELKIIIPKKDREPSMIGITSWVGPGKYASFGDYGLLNYLNDNDGAFVHKDHIIDNSKYIKLSHLYKMDVAKSNGKPICLNACEINSKDSNLIETIAYDNNQDPRVRLKAHEWLARNQGRFSKFDSDLKDWANENTNNNNNNTDESISFEMPGGFKYSSKGTPSDSTITVIKTFTYGTIAVASISAIALILSRVNK